MGHEISTTTVQLAQAVSAVANGGLLVKPRLILSRQRPGETAVKEPLAPGAPDHPARDRHHHAAE